MEKDLSIALKLSPLFQGLTAEQISGLMESGSMRVVQYKRNDILYWTDKQPDKLYILVKGNIAMAKDTLTGKRSLSKSICEPGEITGEVRLFSPKKLLWEYAVALEDSTVLEIASRLFVEQGSIQPEIQIILLRNIIGDVVEKIDNLGQKVRILSVASARKRIALYLLGLKNENGRILLTSTREELADYLGMARPSLSRELGRMQNEGLIKIEDKEVFILDQAAFDELFE